MEIDLTAVGALTLILSSAVVSALVNVAWNAFARLLDKWKENRKINHVYLDLVLQLEDFARRCSERIYDIEEALGGFYGDRDGDAFQGFGPIVLEFAPSPDWRALPVRFVADVRSLPPRFDQCNTWIATQFQLWADLDDAYELEKERLAFYALKACRIAMKTRKRIGAEEGDLYNVVAQFEELIARGRSSFLDSSTDLPFIPELRAQFARERVTKFDSIMKALWLR